MKLLWRANRGLWQNSLLPIYLSSYSYYASTIFAPQMQPRPVKRPRLMATSQTRANVLVNSKLAVAATNTLALAQQLQQQQHAQVHHQQLQQLLSSASSLSPPLGHQQPNGLLNNNSHSITNANNNCNLNSCNNNGTSTSNGINGNDLLGIGLCNNNNNNITTGTTNGQQQTSAAAQFMINGQHVVGPFKTYSE